MWEYNATVIRVIDGDTLHIGKAKISLEGIDAPPIDLYCKKITI